MSDEDRQVRNQVVYEISDEELKNKLFEKGNTLTQVEAIHQLANPMKPQNKKYVLEISIKRKTLILALSKDKDKPKEVLLCNYCANKKGAHSFSNKRVCPACIESSLQTV